MKENSSQKLMKMMIIMAERWELYYKTCLEAEKKYFIRKINESY